MKRIAVLASDGDAPGMNAAIRAVMRSGAERGWSVVGVADGYAGSIAGSFRPLGDRDVGSVIQRGGTMLGSARCPEMQTEPGQHQECDRRDPARRGGRPGSVPVRARARARGMKETP